MLIDTLAFVRARLDETFSLRARPADTSTTTSSEKDESGSSAPVRSATLSTPASSTGVLTVAHLFARGDDALGVARAELHELLRPESLESALMLVIDVLETTRVCVATVRGARRAHNGEQTAHGNLLVRADERLIELASITDDLLARARVAVGQELYRRVVRVVPAERIDALLIRALRAERGFYDLVDSAQFENEGHVHLVKELLVAFHKRIGRDLDSEGSGIPRKLGSSSMLPGFVLKLTYPEIVDVGQVVTIVARVRNDLAHPIRLAALDIDEEIAAVLDIQTVSPSPLSRALGDGVLTLSFDLVLAPLETCDLVLTALVTRPTAVSGEISAWTESAEIAIAFMALDAVLMN
jgi:hypothetical protein